MNNSINKLDPNWVTGFVDGEGCFFINIVKVTDQKIDYSVKLQIIVGQHYRDKLLLKKIANVLGSGKIYERKNSNTVVLTIYNFKEIYNKIIHIFNQYKIGGEKYKDYQDFCLAAELISKKNAFDIRRIKTNSVDKVKNEEIQKYIYYINVYILYVYLVD